MLKILQSSLDSVFSDAVGPSQHIGSAYLFPLESTLAGGYKLPESWVMRVSVCSVMGNTNGQY